MVELREIVRRWEGGEDVRAIARATGMDRKTIAEYLRVAQAAGVRPDGGPPSDEQLTTIAAAPHPGRAPNTEAPKLDALRAAHGADPCLADRRPGGDEDLSPAAGPGAARLL